MDRDKVLEILLERVEAVRDIVTSLKASLDERCPDHSRRLVQIETTLHGTAENGNNPGLIGRVATIEQAIKRLHRARNWAFMVTGAIVGGIVVAVVEKML